MSEYQYDASELLPEIAPVRELLIGGDLRPLYLAWLACNGDEERLEPPVPAGLDKLTPALVAMAELYEVSDDVIAAAAVRSPPLPKATDADQMLNAWIAKQSRDTLRQVVAQFLASDGAAARAQTLSRIRDETGAATWPLAEATRTRAQLQQSADELRDQRSRRGKAAAEAERRKRLAAIAKDPEKVIANVDRLVKLRSTDSYRQGAAELVELREALGIAGPARVRTVAENLRRQYPRQYRLISILREHGLLD